MVRRAARDLSRDIDRCAVAMKAALLPTALYIFYYIAYIGVSRDAKLDLICRLSVGACTIRAFCVQAGDIS